MKYKFLNRFSNLLFCFSILTFIIAFNFRDNLPPGGWYQQFMPNLNGASITDITFADSLIGYAVTNEQAVNDTDYILKTTDGGDNWNVIRVDSKEFVGFNRIIFLNKDTGYVTGVNGLERTINGGTNWVSLNVPDPFLVYDDMSILNEDTIWLAASSGFTGGVFRTTNGGVNWTHQVNLGGNNPTHIYMYNKDTGYVAGTTLYKTTNSGIDWLQIPGGGFGDMYFINATTGWKCYGPMQKTTDGGLSWDPVPLPPQGGFFNLSAITNFSFIGKDTIWGVGSRGATVLGFRGLIYISTNAGQSWGYQLPDTNSIIIARYFNIDFINELVGWAYSTSSGVHTVTGGDTTYYPTSVTQISGTTPSDYKLFQNYPNPFNPLTKIKYELKTPGFIKLNVYNINGKEVKTIVNEKQNTGVYEADFSATEYGSSLSSGVYFYSLFAGEELVDTKKMIVLK